MSNYFIGNNQSQWHTNIPTYGKVAYQNVYPGVSLDYYGNQGMLEYDFTVSPGVSPGVIKFAVQGAQSVTLDAQGDLVLGLPGGPLIEHAPTLYQTIDGVQHDVSGGFVLSAGDQVGFQVGAYDTALPLVIDPTLAYSTYLGGSLGDKATAVAVNQAGDAYVTGETGSNDFPLTTGVYDNKLNGSGTPGNTVTDVFVTEFNPSGQLVYSTYIGGQTDDHATGIAILNGNAYVTGWTDSSNFPTTTGALQSSFGGGTAPGDGFVTELNGTGKALLYSTYLGGHGSDEPQAIAVDSAGDAYVVGQTESNNFPTKNAAPVIQWQPGCLPREAQPHRHGSRLRDVHRRNRLNRREHCRIRRRCRSQQRGDRRRWHASRRLPHHAQRLPDYEHRGKHKR